MVGEESESVGRDRAIVGDGEDFWIGAGAVGVAGSRGSAGSAG